MLEVQSTAAVRRCCWWWSIWTSRCRCALGPGWSLWVYQLLECSRKWSTNATDRYGHWIWNKILNAQSSSIVGHWPHGSLVLHIKVLLLNLCNIQESFVFPKQLFTTAPLLRCINVFAHTFSELLTPPTTRGPTRPCAFVPKYSGVWALRSTW